MEHLYNPDRMSEQEIKGTFVARQALLDRLITLIERQPEGAGVRHAILIAPRGMGKTTLLLMVQFAVIDRGLSPPWLPIRFPEELYGVGDLADFWLETLANVAQTTEDAALAQSAQELKQRYPDSATLQEAALALLRGWCRDHQRRLLLLVDNVQQVLATFDEQQSAALRRVLMNEGFLMLLGTAPSFFKEASDYGEPLYNFFQIERLERLRFDEVRELLIQRARADDLTDFDKTLDANRTRLRVLEYFTGGNVRLALMLYRILTRSDVSELRRDLELLLDQVTPYYKDKTEALPAQQRKILDAIARTSGQTHEGVSPSEIARAVRLTPQVVSAQLKRLADAGYVQPANLRGRSTSYTLSEPLYSLWYQMRFGRDARERMGWLVSFLKSFYTAEELGEQSHIIGDRLQRLVAAGLEQQARSALEHLRWLTEAIQDNTTRSTAMEEVIKGCLAVQDATLLKDVLKSELLNKNLPLDTLRPLLDAGHLSRKEFVSIGLSRVLPLLDQDVPALALVLRGLQAYIEEKYDTALSYYAKALGADPKFLVAYVMRALVLVSLKQMQEASQSIAAALELEPEDAQLWAVKAAFDCVAGNYESTLAASSEAELRGLATYELKRNYTIALIRLNRLEDALVKLDEALALEPSKDTSEDWGLRGALLRDLKRFTEAIESYDRALAGNNQDSLMWWHRGKTLTQLKCYKEVIENYDKAIDLGLKDPLLFIGRGVAYYDLGRSANALEDITTALSYFGDSQFTQYLIESGVVPSLDTAKEAQIRLYLVKIALEIKLGKVDAANADWAFVKVSSPMPAERVEFVIEVLLETAKKGHSKLVRELLVDTGIESPFFPLTRALDYLETGDAALIERLTPEMRPIVEEVVAKLRSAKGDGEPEPP